LGGRNFRRFTARYHLSPCTGWSIVIGNYYTGVEWSRVSIVRVFGLTAFWVKIISFLPLMSKINGKIGTKAAVSEAAQAPVNTSGGN